MVITILKKDQDTQAPPIIIHQSDLLAIPVVLLNRRRRATKIKTVSNYILSTHTPRVESSLFRWGEGREEKRKRKTKRNGVSGAVTHLLTNK